MVGLGRGLDFLREQQEKQPVFSGNFTKNLFVKDGDIAQLWWIYDHDNLLVPLLHSLAKVSKKGNSYYKQVLCERTTYDDPPEKCSYCMLASPDGDVSSARLQGVAPVYVTYILHAQQADSEWRAQKTPFGVKYVEMVNEVRLFVLKTKLLDQVQAALYSGSDLLDTEGEVHIGSLLDAPWKLAATGQKQAKSETLAPMDKKEVPQEVVAIRTEGIDLEQLLKDNFTEGEAEKKPELVAVGTAASAAPRPTAATLGDIDLGEEEFSFDGATADIEDITFE